MKASDGTPGYDDTTNPGGEYKVWVSTVSTFDADKSKTDNFKVKGGPPVGTEPPKAELIVHKFYDANANGIDDDAHLITGWKMTVQQILDPFYVVRFTGTTPIDIFLDPGLYAVAEALPLESNWRPTTPSVVSPVDLTCAEGSHGLCAFQTVEFGNVCLGPGGGLTLGFWSNPNGQRLFGAGDLALMIGLHLRKANGADFDPAGYTAFRNWLLSANAVNMAYMLSAQLAAMELNVFNGFVNSAALIYAPGSTSANALGFATVGAIMAEANAELGTHGLTLTGSPYRAYQEALKNALDKANNNLTFVQSAPCPFSFLP